MGAKGWRVNKAVAKHSECSDKLGGDGGDVVVALGYDSLADDAPSVLAVGKHEMAKGILKTARRYGVPVEVNDGLAKKLAILKEDDFVPEDCYSEVARILIKHKRAS